MTIVPFRVVLPQPAPAVIALNAITNKFALMNYLEWFWWRHQDSYASNALFFGIIFVTSLVRELEWFLSMP